MDVVLGAWQEAGEINLCANDWPAFGAVPRRPGLYRITLSDQSVYIGQSGNLHRRLHEYRRPTAGVEGEDILHHALRTARGGWLAIRVDDALHDTKTRLLAERAEIIRAKEVGLELLNPGFGNRERRLRDRIAFHERQIEKLQRLLGSSYPII